MLPLLHLALAADPTFPTLPGTAATPEAFVPAGWVIGPENEAVVTIRGWAGLTGAPRTTGDLDGDGKEDRVLVLEPAVIDHPLPDDCIACQKPSWPRALVVLGAQGAGWRLLGVADWGRASMEARIDRGRLLVTVGTYGGWSARAQELIYRLEGGRFRLIVGAGRRPWLAAGPPKDERSAHSSPGRAAS